MAAALVSRAAEVGLEAAEELPRPYLMLVTFGAPQLGAWTEESLKVLNESPYAGVASEIVGAYDTEPVPTRAAFDDAVAALRKQAKKHVWPWVFSNRFIGRSEEGPAHSGAADSDYFRRIQGWDLKDKAGAQSDFYALWRLALRLARDLDAPGVVLDLEAYNDYRTYNVNTLAEQTGQSAQEVIADLRTMGRQMAVIVAEEYPQAIVWTLFTYLGAGTTPDYLCQGLLEEAKQRDLPLKVVDGGEAPLGYYSPSADALERKLASYAARLHPFLEQYPQHLRMGGTLAPYHEPARLTDWIKNASEKGGRVYQNAEEFRPLLDELFASCEYVWMYGASAAHYVPFNPGDAPTTQAVHTVLADEIVRWQEAYRLLPLPQWPALAVGNGRRAVPSLPEREYRSLLLALSEWQKGDPNTDLTQPEVTVEREEEIVKEGDAALKFAVRMDWKNPPDSKYPVGWPMVRHRLDPPLDLSDYDFFEFWVQIRTDAVLPAVPLKYGLSNNDAEPVWQEVHTDRTDEWVQVRLPLDEIGPRERVTRLTFYVAESWYRDGDMATFYLDGLRCLQQTTPEIQQFAVHPLLYGRDAPTLTATYRLAGDVVEAGYQLRLLLTPRGGGTPVREQTVPVTARQGELTTDLGGLPPGGYTAWLELRAGDGAERDAAERMLAVLDEMKQ
jgi:hypothetical protein